MIILKKGKYAISNISGFKGGSATTYDVKDGLGIEKQCPNGENMYVICFIKFDAKEGRAEIESIGANLLDIEVSEFALVKSLISAAISLVEAANVKEEED